MEGGWSIRDPRYGATYGGMENPPSDDGTEPLLAMSTSVIPAASRVYAHCCTVGQLVIKYLRSRLSPLWLVWLVNSKLLISRRQACILSLYVRRIRSSLPPHLGGLSNGELTFSALCQRKALDRGRRQHAPARRHIPSPWCRLVTTRRFSSMPLTVLCVKPSSKNNTQGQALGCLQPSTFTRGYAFTKEGCFGRRFCRLERAASPVQTLRSCSLDYWGHIEGKVWRVELYSPLGLSASVGHLMLSW